MVKVRYNGPETFYSYEGVSGLRYRFNAPNREAEVKNEADIKMFKEKEGGFTVIDGVNLGNLPKAKRGNPQKEEKKED
ncbi:MAG TPA: hypothetical protein PLK43_08135 [Caldisericia bacterium]|jgi:hypothetical protein|nr:hypothetical protein [Caldisericia bacterium]HUN19552.1 hypothetical protein [Caldisericia bacterium]